MPPFGILWAFPPNPPFQLTASRARSLLFERLLPALAAAERQTVGPTLGITWCDAVSPLRAILSTLHLLHHIQRSGASCRIKHHCPTHPSVLRVGGCAVLWQPPFSFLLARSLQGWSATSS